MGNSCFLEERNFLGDFSDTTVFKLGFLSFKSVLDGGGVHRFGAESGRILLQDADAVTFRFARDMPRFQGFQGYSVKSANSHYPPAACRGGRCVREGSSSLLTHCNVLCFMQKKRE